MKKWNKMTAIEKAQEILGLEKWNEMDEDERLAALEFVENPLFDVMEELDA